MGRPYSELFKWSQLVELSNVLLEKQHLLNWPKCIYYLRAAQTELELEEPLCYPTRSLHAADFKVNRNTSQRTGTTIIMIVREQLHTQTNLIKGPINMIL